MGERPSASSTPSLQSENLLPPCPLSSLSRLGRQECRRHCGLAGFRSGRHHGGSVLDAEEDGKFFPFFSMYSGVDSLH
ncbi:hypothetical protein TIFTF001_014108 [Ficus carica]|uniref:Uncharacterized protein n=1 Tax=Ficus carica TaxID=3494 RepID=A0AA88D6P5_FICCA|nr:hypothetical protein TIFTF001_014108 [Ficus carica]